MPSAVGRQLKDRFEPFIAGLTLVSWAIELPAFFWDIASVFAWISLVAWVITFANMLITWWRRSLSSGA